EKLEVVRLAGMGDGVEVVEAQAGGGEAVEVRGGGVSEDALGGVVFLDDDDDMIGCRRRGAQDRRNADDQRQPNKSAAPADAPLPSVHVRPSRKTSRVCTRRHSSVVLSNWER